MNDSSVYMYNTCRVHVQYLFLIVKLHSYMYFQVTCTVHVQYIRNTCTLHLQVQYMHNTCTVHVQYMYSTCTIHVQYMYSTCTVHAYLLPCVRISSSIVVSVLLIHVFCLNQLKLLMLSDTHQQSYDHSIGPDPME